MKTQIPYQIRKKQRLVIAEEFRAIGLPRLGGIRWMVSQTRIPLTRKELRIHLRRCRNEAELLHLRRMAERGLECAASVTHFKLAREYVKEAMRLSKGERSAQVTLADILCSTRFKF